MLFDRRHKPRLHHHARNLVWPKTGWRRASRYLVHRVRRMPGTPHVIAAGFACGAAISMTPFPGFHFVIAALFAWAIRGSILASAIGTAVGNPWTFPFIWVWIFNLGNWILRAEGVGVSQEITMSYIFDHPLDVLVPMMVGSVPTAIVVWVVFYWLIRRAVESYQARRRHRLGIAQSRGGDAS